MKTERHMPKGEELITMKKYFLTMTAAAILLSGCASSGTSAKTVDLEAVKTGISAIEDVPAMMELSSEDITSFLGVKPEDYTASVCFVPLMNVTATEVLLFQYESDTQKTAIQNALDTRLKQLENTWSQYLPDQYDLVKKRTSVDENSMLGYIIGEDAFVTEVKQLIKDNTK
ncbi:MAG: DUF4358 domain-containing protein [Erysipelotrichia bacterium]|nr:DUF4358 domain-containing protein [Erysipelotrichia bacterium]